MLLRINRFYLTFRISAMAKRQESMRKLWQIWTLILTVGGLLHYPNKNLDWPLDGISGLHPALGWVGRGLSDGRGGTGSWKDWGPGCDPPVHQQPQSPVTNRPLPFHWKTIHRIVSLEYIWQSFVLVIFYVYLGIPCIVWIVYFVFDKVGIWTLATLKPSFQFQPPNNFFLHEFLLITHRPSKTPVEYSPPWLCTVVLLQLFFRLQSSRKNNAELFPSVSACLCVWE